jgi:hypothetical protein
MMFALPLPPFSPKGSACNHNFAAVPRWVKTSQSLLQREMYIGDRRNHHLTTFDRNTNPLIDVQMRLTGNCRRQAYAQIVAPLLNIKHGLRHDSFPKKNGCIYESINNYQCAVNGLPALLENATLRLTRFRASSGKSV